MVDEALFNKVRNHLLDALTKGYKQPVVMTGAHTEMLNALQKNLTVFSLFKNHHNMRDVAFLLTQDGKQRPYTDFEKEALQVSINYNKNWLQTEYNTAISAAKSAESWVDIQQTKEEFTLLRYVTKHDDRVRDEHRSFDGVTLPVEHPYWNTHFPPNGFNCRCYVEKLKPIDKDGNPVKVTKMKNEETYASEFNFNVGKTKQIFSENETYFKNLDDLTIKRLKEYSENVALKPNRW